MKEKPSVDLLIVCNRKRKLDHDNLVGGLKQLIDALVSEGFLYDDAPKYVRNMHIIQNKNVNEFIEISRFLTNKLGN